MKEGIELYSARLFTIGLMVGLLGFQACKKDDPTPPIQINFSAATLSVTEGSQINITLQLSRPATREGSVHLVLTGDAAYTSDYNTNPSGITGNIEVIFTEGTSTHTITVATVNNEIYSGNKMVVFALQDPAPEYLIGAANELTLTIEEDEGPAVANFEFNTGSVSESSVSGLVMQIPFSEPAQGPGSVTITWASNNSSYETNFTTLPAAASNTISYAIADGAEGLTLTLVPKDDSFFHENYVVVFEITATSGSVKAGTSNRTTVTITEDESPSFASFPVTDALVSEAATVAQVVPVSLSIPASETGTITVSFTSGNAVYGTHFTTSPAASGSNIVLNVAKDAVASQFTILPIDNAVDNVNRLIQFTISSGTGVVRPGGNISYILTITDNEPTLRSVFISFGRSSAPLVTGSVVWNHLYDDSPSAGDTWTNLLRSDGVATLFDIVMNSSLTPQPLGAVTGINSGVFPDNAMKEYWYVPGPNQGITRGFSILQLDNAETYTIKIHGGTTATSSDGKNTMTIAINGDQKAINDVTNNVSQLLLWSNINPSVSIFTVNLTDSETGGICPINAMEISWYED